MNYRTGILYLYSCQQRMVISGGQTDADVVIEVPERGKAVQFGRFNQSGEISIF